MQLPFYIAGAVAIVATFLAITRLNAVHALLYLIVSLLSVALVFFCVGAPFVATLEVIVYAGAIMVLFVFVVMMMNLGPPAIEMERQLLTPGIWIGPAILSAILIVEMGYLFHRGVPPEGPMHVVGPKQVGVALFGPYLIGVELASILLMAGLVGAYHLSSGPGSQVETRDDIHADARRTAVGRDLVRDGVGRPAGTQERDLHADVR
ncbi:MAG: NADH-quinone oxidoreductase subunit J [Bryobacteraceae bacterium]